MDNLSCLHLSIQHMVQHNGGIRSHQHNNQRNIYRSNSYQIKGGEVDRYHNFLNFHKTNIPLSMVSISYLSSSIQFGIPGYRWSLKDSNHLYIMDNYLFQQMYISNKLSHSQNKFLDYYSIHLSIHLCIDHSLKPLGQYTGNIDLKLYIFSSCNHN